MIEQQESQENLDDGIRTFEMRVSVPGEPGVYTLQMPVSQDQLDLPEVDIPDDMILRMAHEIRNFRRKKMWGECVVGECTNARSKNWDRCPPHAWDEDRKKVTNVLPQYPPAL